MQYAAAALDSGPDIRQFVRDKTRHAKAILENMLMEMYKETAPAKQTDLDEKITKCRTTTVEEYILDALAILFNEEPFIKTFTLAVKNQAVIITHLYISVKPCITYTYMHVRYCPQNGRNDTDDEVAAFARSSASLPVVWVKCRKDWAVVVEGRHVYRQTTICDSFIAFFASFAMFDIDWCKNCKV